MVIFLIKLHRAKVGLKITVPPSHTETMPCMQMPSQAFFLNETDHRISFCIFS